MKKIFLSLTLSFIASRISAQVNGAYDASILHELNESLTQAVIYDGFSPPVASRIYAYCNIGAYEALRVGMRDKKSLVNQLHFFDHLDDKIFDKNLDHRVVMIESFRLVARDVVYRFFYVDSVSQKQLKTLSNRINKKTYDASIKAAEQLHTLIQKRIKTDNYLKTRVMPKFTPSDEEGHWQPTYPTYGDALEPYWWLLEPFTIDSLTQFKVKNPPHFSSQKESDFYNGAEDVYKTANTLTPEEKEICLFWDCNPQKTSYNGHLMYKTRQLTPGGHWIGITRYACLQNNTDLLTTSKIYALVTIAIADAFINTWAVKFRTDNIRPITYIQQYIDPNWKPMLETPLFPEHPSAHSAISGAAGAVLDNFFDDNTTFMDSTEVPFGLQPRLFRSFSQAANEAAISRVYGGIHYRTAAEEGLKLGHAIGNNILHKIKLN